MSASPGDRAVILAGRMLELGISRDMVTELLSYPLDQVEAQLNWLPLRKTRRPSAFLIAAIRRNYSPPKTFIYANAKTLQTRPNQAVHEDSEPPY